MGTESAAKSLFSVIRSALDYLRCCSTLCWHVKSSPLLPTRTASGPLLSVL